MTVAELIAEIDGNLAYLAPECSIGEYLWEKGYLNPQLLEEDNHESSTSTG